MANAIIIKELIKELKTNISRFERDIGVGTSTIGKAIARNSKIDLDIAQKITDKYPAVSKNWLMTGEGDMFLKDFIPTQLSPGDEIRSKKAFGEKEQQGLIFVPIKAQAGYSLRYDEQVYLEQLERTVLPGMPYDGEKYRIFEVEGDSMEPTLQEGFYVIAEKVEHSDYQFTTQWYIYVVITDESVVIKRLFRKDGFYVMISDNAEYYPQKKLPIELVKELWLVKRKMDWHMPPPKKFELDF